MYLPIYTDNLCNPLAVSFQDIKSEKVEGFDVAWQARCLCCRNKVHGLLLTAETLRLILASLTGSVTVKLMTSPMRSQSAVLNIAVHVSHKALLKCLIEHIQI